MKGNLDVGDSYKVPLVDVDLDDGDWIEDQPYSDVFACALWVVMHTKGRFSYDPTLSKEKQRSVVDHGTFDVDGLEGGWKGTLNWTSSWFGSIPPRHLGVKRFDDVLGILSCWETIRTCWHCRKGGWYGPGKARVRPRVPCPWCKHSDWLGQEVLAGEPYIVGGGPVVSRYDFHQACENRLAALTGEPPITVAQPMWIAKDLVVH